MFVKIAMLCAAFFCFYTLFAQQPVIMLLDSGHKTSLRGLSVPNDSVVWASGSNGTVARSTNGGKTFAWMTVWGYENRDFRDVQAFSADTALIMAVAEPAVILKTNNGGKSWHVVFSDTTKGMFLDAMDFLDKKHGVVVGDPVDSTPFFSHTFDGGEHWLRNEAKIYKTYPKLDTGEAFFAASGTNVVYIPDRFRFLGQSLLVSGGTKSELLSEFDFFRNSLPLAQGTSSTGANSIAFNTDPSVLYNAVIVGGDFAHDTVNSGNCVLAHVGTASFIAIAPQTPPHGYRSCVEFITKTKLIACGTSGIDVSDDGGLNWRLVSRQSFHVCQKSKTGSAIFLAGANGKIAAYR